MYYKHIQWIHFLEIKIFQIISITFLNVTKRASNNVLNKSAIQRKFINFPDQFTSEEHDNHHALLEEYPLWQAPDENHQQLFVLEHL